MEILGSANQVFAAGANTIQLSRSGLTVIGVTVSNNAISIPIDSGRNAVIVGGGSSFNFIPLTFKLNTNEMNYTGISGGGLLIVYYGIPDADEPTLDEYAGVYQNFTDIVVGTATGYQTAQTLTVDFPSGKYVMKAILLSGSNASNGGPGQWTAAFAISPGEVVTYGTNASKQNPHGQGAVLPIADLPAPDQLSVTANVYMFIAATAASTAGLLVVIYYALPGKTSKMGSGSRGRSVVGGLTNPFGTAVKA